MRKYGTRHVAKMVIYHEAKLSVVLPLRPSAEHFIFI